MNKKKAFWALILVCVMCVTPLFGAVRASATAADINDKAGVLSSAEFGELKTVLSDAANKTGLNIGIYIVNSLEDTGKADTTKAADTYSEDVFGTSGDSVALLVVLGTGNGDGAWMFSTTGEGIKVMYDSAQIDTWANMQSDVKNGNYAAAVRTYASSVINFKNEYDSRDVSRGPKPGLTGIIAVVVGFIGGLIRGGSLKGQLKSVQIATTASDCIKKDSFRLTRSGDVFLYRTEQRTKRSTEDKTSTTHVSESGTTHGGVGGTF